MTDYGKKRTDLRTSLRKLSFMLYFTAVVFARGKGIIVLKPKTRGQ